MTQLEFKKWVSELPEENDNLQVTYEDRYEDKMIVEDYGTGTYYDEGILKSYILLFGWKMIC